MKKLKLNIYELTTDSKVKRITECLNKLKIKHQINRTGLMKRELLLEVEATTTDDEILALGCLIGAIEGSYNN